MDASASKRMKPNYKVGDFCRITREGSQIECFVGTINGENAMIKSLGYEEEINVPCKELLPSSGKVARENQEFAAYFDQPKMDWKVGEYCRIKWKVDEKIYEGKIDKIDTADDYQYVFVQLLGYPGDSESAWINEIIPSLGEEARKAQEKAALDEIQATTPTGQVQDDKKPEDQNKDRRSTSTSPVEGSSGITWKENSRCRAICTADGQTYEATVKEVYPNGEGKIHFIGMNIDEVQLLKELQKSLGSDAREKQRKKYATTEVPKAIEWKVEMPCRGIYSEDGLEYEGDITSIEKSEEGAQYAVVKFIGYGNEEAIWLENLLPSSGEEARKAQIKASGAEIQNAEVAPTVEWKVDMPCKAIYSEDGQEYEGDIVTIDSQDGAQYANVRFCGYGNEECIWLENLLPSAGEEARQAQIKASGAEVANPEHPPAPDANDGTIVNGKPEVNNNTEVPEAKQWKVDMPCRAVFSEDGLEYEGDIVAIDSQDGAQYANVRFCGYGNEECIWLENLLPSTGEEARKAQILASGAEVTPAPDAIDGSAVVDETGNKQWKVEMPCRAVFSEDGQEYEGDIIAIDSQDGAQYAIVRFCGYGNEESIWLENLISSAGEEIRKAQIQASGAEVPTSEEPIVENQTKVEKDENKNNVQTQEKVEKVETNGIAENKTESKVLTSTPNKVGERQKQEVHEPKEITVNVNVTKETAITTMNCNGIKFPSKTEINGSNKTNDMDENNNENVGQPCPKNMDEAIKQLNEEIKGLRTINSLRRILDVRDEEIRILREKIVVSETVISEMRETNLYLHKENERLQEAEAKSNSNVAQLYADIKTTLSKMNERNNLTA